jgi:membrane-bound lytic murein transglycosylase D
VSKSGAVGLWQFMPATAESFGLKTRDDPIESTKTACVFIKHLFSKYKNWKTALMAYNAGEPRIDNYLANKGDPLTSETLNYYPQLMALQKIINDITTGSKKYGFKPKSIKTHFKRYILYAMFL